jgi:hypothetical protein
MLDVEDQSALCRGGDAMFALMKFTRTWSLGGRIAGPIRFGRCRFRPQKVQKVRNDPSREFLPILIFGKGMRIQDSIFSTTRFMVAERMR